MYSEWNRILESNLVADFPNWLEDLILNSHKKINPLLFDLAKAIKNNNSLAVELILASKDLTRQATSLQLAKAEKNKNISDGILNNVIALSIMRYAEHPRIIYAILAAGFSPLDLGFVLKNYGAPIAYATFLNILPNLPTSNSTSCVPLIYKNTNTYSLEYNLLPANSAFKFSYQFAPEISQQDKMMLDLQRINVTQEHEIDPLAILSANLLSLNKQKFTQQKISALKMLVVIAAISAAGFAYVTFVRQFGKSIPKSERTQELYEWYKNAKVVCLFLQTVAFISLVGLGCNLKNKYDEKSVKDRNAKQENLPADITSFDFKNAQKNLPNTIAERFYSEFFESKPPSLLFWQQAFVKHQELLAQRTKENAKKSFGFKPGFLLNN